VPRVTERHFGECNIRQQRRCLAARRTSTRVTVSLDTWTGMKSKSCCMLMASTSTIPHIMMHLVLLVVESPRRRFFCSTEPFEDVPALCWSIGNSSSTGRGSHRFRTSNRHYSPGSLVERAIKFNRDSKRSSFVSTVPATTLVTAISLPLRLS
jgi:hypothetical protein